VFTFLLRVGTPPPRSIGSSVLAENVPKILAAQDFAGKILKTLDLETTPLRSFFEAKYSKY
jgi:hypothetical protein